MKSHTFFLITPGLLQHLKSNFSETLESLLKKYKHSDLKEIGLELENLSESDQNFLVSIMNEYLVDLKHGVIE